MQKPKLAATVLVCMPLINDGNTPKDELRSDYRILMVKRSGKSRFMPHAHVFPGGITEEIDSNDRWKDLLAQHESERSEVNNPFLTFKIAAVRELLEEANLFISTRYFSDSELQPWRQKVQSNANEMLQMCETFQCTPECSRLIPWSHWITPIQEKWRYDTHFFVAPLRADTIVNAMIDEKETVSHNWFRPEEAIESFKKGNIYLSPPTWFTLKELLQFSKLSELIAFGKKGRDMSAIEPHFFQDEKGRAVIIFPGDADHPERPIPNRRNRLIILEGNQYELEKTDGLTSSL